MNCPALADRLYAERLAAPLRDPAWFYKASSSTNEASVDAYVSQRSVILREEISSTAADVECAIKQVERSWEWGEEKQLNSPYRIVSLLSHHAKRLLKHSGREMILKVVRNSPGREILRWRFVSLALPPGILIAAATRSGFAPPEAVRLLDASIAPDEPVAQNHVHHAAMMSFEELWVSLHLRALLRPGELMDSLLDKRALCPGLHPGKCLGGKSEAERRLAKKRPSERAKHMAEWGDLIRQAFIARRVLDRHSHHGGPLEECCDPVCVEVRTTLRAFLAGRTKSYRASATSYPWPDDLILLARRYRQANAPAISRHSDARRWELIGEQTAEERGLLVRAFKYLHPKETDSPDSVYETLFVQYLRVMTAVFGLLVHPPGEPGLRKFLEHFLQIKVYAPESDLVRPRRPNEPGLDVRAMEYRVAPDAWFEILRRHDDEIEEDPTPEESRPETAWLIHFKRKGHDEQRLPLYGSAVRTMDSEADQIARALAAKPGRLRTLLRGVDICGVEEAQPLWVSAETLRRLRTRSSEISGQRPRLRLEPLRLTLHAGEDFRCLTSGMRAIAEPFHWKLIERGDRIGHGIAITLDPNEWWKRNRGRVISVKRFERLMDLAFLAEYADNPTSEQNKWLRDEIEEALRGLRLQPKPENASAMDMVETTRAVWRDLGGRPTRRLMTMLKRPRYPVHEDWIYRYLWDRSLQDRAEDEIRLPIEDESKERGLLVKARARLIQEVARWQVCIECNPSSNLVVGGLDAMGAAQDFLQRRPTRNEEEDEETLTWTISTDDPITFSTTLADEYAYAWAGMVLRDQKPYDPSYARALLDEAAATSMRMRFTIPRDYRKATSTGKRRGEGRARRD
jgi:hypothetical protein